MRRALLACTVASAFTCGAQAQEVVRIGSASAVSGPSAHLGKDTENGARLAVEDLNAKGFTVNGKKIRFELVAEDDASDPKQGTAAAQKLVDAKVVGVIGHLNSGTTIPASKIYRDAGIPQISPSSTTSSYTRQGYPTAFRVVVDNSKMAETLGHYAVQTLHAKNVAVIDDRSSYGQDLADQFAKGVKASGQGARIVGREFTTPTATDFTAILTKLRAQKPDVIFYGGMDAVAGPMLKQIKALGINARFVGGDGVCSENLPMLAGDALGENKVTCAVAGGVTGEQEKAYDRFVARYQERFGIKLQTYAPYAYDGVMVLALAMQRAKSTNPAVFLPELHKLQYVGVTGPIAFDQKGDLTDGRLTLYTYKDGKLTKLAVVH